MGSSGSASLLDGHLGPAGIPLYLISSPSGRSWEAPNPPGISAAASCCTALSRGNPRTARLCKRAMSAASPLAGKQVLQNIGRVEE